MAVASSVLDAVGHTPVIELRRFFSNLPHRVFAKCEFLNPGGSIKDRIGRAMVEQARACGRLADGGVVVEATAGNTGVGLAIAAIAYGHAVIAVMTTKASDEKVRVMEAFGATVVRCPYDVAPDHPDHFINTARRIARETPGGWFADQFANPANRLEHLNSTGPELWQQSDGQIDIFMAGIGTGGTLCGVGAFLKARAPAVRVVAADPDGSILAARHRGEDGAPKPYLVEGIGGDFVPALLDFSVIDEVVSVPDRDAIAAMQRVTRTEGLFVGSSSGTILAAAERLLARTPGATRTFLILPDGGRSYLSTMYDPAWRTTRQLD